MILLLQLWLAATFGFVIGYSLARWLSRPQT